MLTTKVFPVTEFAKEVGLSPRQIRRLIASRKISAIRPGSSKFLIPESELTKLKLESWTRDGEAD